MNKSERRKQIDVRCEILEEYITYLKQKGLSDTDIQKYIIELNEPLFKSLVG